MPNVTFIYNCRTKIVEGKDGQTVLQIALDNGIPMEHACGGNGFCTTCMSHITAGMNNLTPRNDREENMGITENPNRLCCQAKIYGDVTVEIPD